MASQLCSFASRYDTAVHWFNRALYHDPRNQVSLRYLGLYHHQSGFSSAAVTYFKRLVDLDPGDSKNIYFLALALQHSGKRQALLFLSNGMTRE